jgi:hypothetical protein
MIIHSIMNAPSHEGDVMCHGLSSSKSIIKSWSIFVLIVTESILMSQYTTSETNHSLKKSHIKMNILIFCFCFAFCWIGNAIRYCFARISLDSILENQACESTPVSIYKTKARPRILSNSTRRISSIIYRQRILQVLEFGAVCTVMGLEHIFNEIELTMIH